MNVADTHDTCGTGAIAGALAVAAAGAVALTFVQLGPLSGHMVAHIVSMNVVAPLVGVAIYRHFPKVSPRASAVGLWLATVGQMALLWALHTPTIHHAAQSSPLGQAALHLALLLSALTFWTCIVAASSRWQAMLALLVSGKLACLLGALMIFAPRLLFDTAALEHGAHAAPFGHTTLSDQHLAGLFMVAACPLSYVLTAIVLAAQTMAALERTPGPAFSTARRALM